MLLALQASNARQMMALTDQVQAITSSNISQSLAPIISRLKALENVTPKASSVLTWGAAADPMGVDDDDYRDYDNLNDADHRRAEEIEREIQATHDDTVSAPCIEGIYRCLYQIPLGVEFVSDYHLTSIHEMSRFYFDFFAYSQTEGEEFDIFALLLPSAVKREFVRDYKAWVRDGQPPGCSGITPAPVPTGPNTRTETRNPTLGTASCGVASAALPKPSPLPGVTGAAGPMAGCGTGLPRAHPPIATLNSQSQDDFVVHDGPTHPALDFDKDVCPSDVVSVPGRWITPNPKCRGRKATSWATVAAQPAPSRAPAPPVTSPLPFSLPSISTDLMKADLEKLPKEALRTVYGDRFGTHVKATTSKDAIIASYVARVHAPAKLPVAPKPPAPKAITLTQYTVVRNPSSAGLTCINAKNTDTAPLVRRLQHVIRQQFPSDQKLPVDLIGGRWSSQFSSNFVLIFNGQPGNATVMRCREVFFDAFSSDCVIVPQYGYSCILLNGVPVCRCDDSSLSTPDELCSELQVNSLCSDITLFSPPRWLRSVVPEGARHSSVTFAFLDEDGKRTAALLKSPLYMFGGSVKAIRFNALPLIKQCQRCWKLGHDATRCSHPSSFLMCCICGGPHKSDLHQFQCSGIRTHNSLKCNCVRKCINCTRAKPSQASGHLAIDHSCPLRKNFRSASARSSDTTDEEALALDRMAKDAPTPTTVPTTAATARVDADASNLNV